MSLLAIDPPAARPRATWTASDWHREAMERADRGDHFAGRGMPCIARSCYEAAHRAEATAAGHFRDRLQYQPTRAVLYRSAAALALRAGDKAACRELCREGLRGAPTELAIEMRGMMAGAGRHDDRKGDVMAADGNEIEIDPISCGCAIIMLGVMAVPFVIALRVVWAMIRWAWNVDL